MTDNLPIDQATFIKNGMFAQSMTGNSSVALDIWIETTSDKVSKPISLVWNPSIGRTRTGQDRT
jgi:hypothetical protein